MKELEQVEYQKLNGPLPKGTKGTIVHVYQYPTKAYEGAIEYVLTNII